VRLPALGEAVSDEFSVGAERKLGDQVMREIRRDPDYIDDPILLDDLEAIFRPLVAAARQRGDIGADTDAQFAWEPFLVRDRSINAFALPGGFIGVNLGLIAATNSRDELAAVLGHELSHVTQRHIARSMVNAKRQSMLGLVAMVLGALAAARARSPDAAQAAIVGGQAAMTQGMLNFSRDMEREADRIGYGVMTTAGYSPAGVATLFEKLDHASRLNDNGSYPYLRSHPLTSERIGEARSRAATAATPPQTNSLAYAAMQGRARALMDVRTQALRSQQASDTAATTTPAERLANLVASALASTQLRDWGRADAALDQAQALARNGGTGAAEAARELNFLRAQTLIARGQGVRALALLEAPDAPRDDSRAFLLLHAQAALSAAAAKAGAPAVASLRTSVESLQTWVSLHPHDGGAWSQLAQNAEQLGWRLRAVRAEAEARAAQGDVSGAVDRLRAARRLVARNDESAGELIDASIIEARLRELELQRRQIEAELRSNGGG
jgi:predicted Zn-dependent protease